MAMEKAGSSSRLMLTH